MSAERTRSQPKENGVKQKTIKLNALASTSIMALALSTGSGAVLADNSFGAVSLESGYQLAHNHKAAEGKCGEAKCGAEQAEDMKSKAAEGKCGEAKCGAEHVEAMKSKAAEGKCGEAKCGAEHAETMKSKAKEGKCGEAKCGAA